MFSSLPLVDLRVEGFPCSFLAQCKTNSLYHHSLPAVTSTTCRHRQRKVVRPRRRQTLIELATDPSKSGLLVSGSFKCGKASRSVRGSLSLTSILSLSKFLPFYNQSTNFVCDTSKVVWNFQETLNDLLLVPWGHIPLFKASAFEASSPVSDCKAPNWTKGDARLFCDSSLNKNPRLRVRWHQGSVTKSNPIWEVGRIENKTAVFSFPWSMWKNWNWSAI